MSYVESRLFFGDRQEFELRNIVRHPDDSIHKAWVINGNWTLVIENGLMGCQETGTMYLVAENIREEKVDEPPPGEGESEISF